MSQIKIKNKNQNKLNANLHNPVLLEEVLDHLSPKKGERYLDVTAGYGGHASNVLELTSSSAVLIDRDPNAIAELEKVFASAADVRIVQSSFLAAATQLVEQGEQFDMILADLGVSSPHFDLPSRGFSLMADGPLDMRMDTTQELTAETVVNTYDHAALTRILSEYGEEPKAKRMADMIIASRPIMSTTQLASIAKKVWPGHSRSHPATRLFQAIRIEVNGELDQIAEGLPILCQLLKPSGRIAIITFHSLEDRIVKRFFKEHAGTGYDAELVSLVKGPVTATPHEIVTNPRARSAKMRVAKRK